MKTLIISTSSSATYSRSKVLDSDLSLSFSTSPTKNFHYFTTGERDINPYKGVCRGSDCNAYKGTSARNVNWSLKNILSLSHPLLDTNLSGSFGLVHSFLYQHENLKDHVRYAWFSSFSVGFKIIHNLNGAFALVTSHSQQKPDSTLRMPFFNRYTGFSFSISSNIFKPFKEGTTQ